MLEARTRSTVNRLKDWGAKASLFLIMKFKVLKDFLHEGVDYKIGGSHDVGELYESSSDGLAVLGFIEIEKPKKKDKKNEMRNSKSSS